MNGIKGPCVSQAGPLSRCNTGGTLLPCDPKRDLLTSLQSSHRSRHSFYIHSVLCEMVSWDIDLTSRLCSLSYFTFLLVLVKEMTNIWGQTTSFFFFLSFLSSTESEDSTEEHTPIPMPDQSLESNSLSELYSNISFLNLNVGM